MIINEATLQSLFVGFRANFKNGLDAAEPMYDAVAMTITSSTRAEEYGWLGQMAGIRKWVGDRVVNKLQTHGFKIQNEVWESTVEVDRDDMADDHLGLYTPLFKQLGQDTALHPDTLAFQLLLDGFTGLAYDGQPFFDTDHPVLDANGVAQSTANTDGGSGDPWFLIDDRKAFKPLIYQQREMFNLVRKDKAEDDNVFHRRKYLYGVDGRNNAGYGLWQLAWGSKQDLTPANYASARAAMMGLIRDGGTRLGIVPTVLLVGPGLEEAARELIAGDRVEEPTQDFHIVRSNVWKDTVKLIVSPFL